jgi:hypothetical protein
MTHIGTVQTRAESWLGVVISLGGVLALACVTPSNPPIDEQAAGPHSGVTPASEDADALDPAGDGGMQEAPSPDEPRTDEEPTVCEALESAGCNRAEANRFDCQDLDGDSGPRECFLFCTDDPAYCGGVIVEGGGSLDVDACFSRCHAEVFCDSHFLPQEAVCDGVVDCSGGEDERDEVCISPDPNFSCLTVTRSSGVPRHRVCDGAQDCVSGIDEPCPESFECERCYCPAEGEPGSCPPYIDCVPGEWTDVAVPGDVLLDGVADCPLGEDEHLPEHMACRTKSREAWCEELISATTGYQCQETEQRIPRRDVCDGVQDCPSGDDEVCTNYIEHCPDQHELVAGFLESLGTGDLAGAQIAVWDGLCDLRESPDLCPFLSCNANGCFFPCANGQLILPHKVFDGRPNCPYGEDEACAMPFSCGENRFVPFDQVCDGTGDCVDASDEAECPTSAEHFVCADGKQIVFPPYPVCGASACADLSDIGGNCPVTR